jgi:hypothetical protein
MTAVLTNRDEGTEFRFELVVTTNPLAEALAGQDDADEILAVHDEIRQRRTEERNGDEAAALADLRATEGIAIQVSMIQALQAGLNPQAGTFKLTPVGEDFSALEGSAELVSMVEQGVNPKLAGLLVRLTAGEEGESDD